MAILDSGTVAGCCGGGGGRGGGDVGTGGDADGRRATRRWSQLLSSQPLEAAVSSVLQAKRASASALSLGVLAAAGFRMTQSHAELETRESF